MPPGDVTYLQSPLKDREVSRQPIGGDIAPWGGRLNSFSSGATLWQDGGTVIYALPIGVQFGLVKCLAFGKKYQET